MLYEKNKEQATFTAAYAMCLFIAGRYEETNNVLAKGIEEYDRHIEDLAGDVVDEMNADEKARAFAHAQFIVPNIRIAIDYSREYQELGIKPPEDTAKDKLDIANRHCKLFLETASRAVSKLDIILKLKP